MSRLSTALVLVGIALGSAGCYATAGAYGDAEYVEADYVPPRIDVYPSYEYGGRTVYLVNDRWYYRRGPRWVYYREEPPELHRRRAYVQQAPRAPGRHAERQHEEERRREEERRAVDLRREEHREEHREERRHD